jgi:hypothetical protein
MIATKSANRMVSWKSLNMLVSFLVFTLFEEVSFEKTNSSILMVSSLSNIFFVLVFPVGLLKVQTEASKNTLWIYTLDGTRVITETPLLFNAPFFNLYPKLFREAMIAQRGFFLNLANFKSEPILVGISPPPRNCTSFVRTIAGCLIGCARLHRTCLYWLFTNIIKLFTEAKFAKTDSSISESDSKHYLS